MQIPIVKFADFLRHRKEFIRIDDFKKYTRARVQLHWRGIVLRDQVEGAAIKTKDQQVARTGELLVAEIDAKVGGIGIVPAELDGAVVSSHYFLFEIDEKNCLRKWLDYFVRSGALEDQVAARGSTNYAAIRPKHVLNFEMPLPLIDKQRRIVARIEELSAKIEEARESRKQATVEVEALLTTARRTTISKCTGETVALEDACAAIIDNLHSNPRLSETGIACVRSPDVGYGTLNLGTALRTNEEEYCRRTVRGEPRADDIVLVREGGGTGKCAVVQPGQRFSLGQRVMMLRPKVQRILPRFFLHQLLSPLVQEDQIARLSKGSASPHLNIGALKRFNLKLPPLSEQRRIVAYLDDLQAKVDTVEKLQEESEAELNALMPSILSRAFSGDL